MPSISTIAGFACAALLALSASPAPAGEGDRQGRKLDTFWTYADSAGIDLRSIALLPAASYDNSLAAEKEIEAAWAPVARRLGYRWFNPTLVKDMLRGSFGGDSVLKALRDRLLKEPRVDSLSAQRLCRALHTTAVLSMRTDVWERTQVEWNQTGRPWTRVSIKAALVDSSGRLLWTASGSETGEGPVHEADAGTIGVKASGLNLQPVTGEGGAPNFQEVLAKLFTRWVGAFPAKRVPASPPSPVPGSGP